jgi:hypothetical protein
MRSEAWRGGSACRRRCTRAKRERTLGPHKGREAKECYLSLAFEEAHSELIYGEQSYIQTVGVAVEKGETMVRCKDIRTRGEGVGMLSRVKYDRNGVRNGTGACSRG